MITLNQNEKILFEVRKHWFILLTEALYLSLAALIPLLSLIFINPDTFPLTIVIEGENHTLLFLSFLYSLWLLFLWMGFFSYWTDYYLDVWYVTNQRIIAVEQRGFFNRDVSSISFNKIQDITVETKGIFATLLAFGNIHVQTAGQKAGSFILGNAASPDRAKQEIIRKRSESSFTSP